MARHNTSKAKEIKIPRLKSKDTQPAGVIIDTGHGGIVRGKYVTPGKRGGEPTDPIYEGVFNREIAMHLKIMFDEAGIQYLHLFDTQLDTPLDDRIEEINNMCDRLKEIDDKLDKDEDVIPELFVVSLHGNGHENKDAQGCEVFTSRGETLSDKIATCLLYAVRNILPPSFSFREDYSDGDPDKQANFAILKWTKCPSVLGEMGFMTNRDDRRFMKSGDGQLLIAFSYFVGTLLSLRDVYGWDFELEGFDEVEELFVDTRVFDEENDFWQNHIINGFHEPEDETTAPPQPTA